MIVLVVMAVLVGQLTELYVGGARCLFNQEAAGHAKVHGQHLAVVEMHQNVFGPPLEALHCTSRQALGKFLRQRKTQVLAALLDLHEASPGQHRGKPASNGLDFRKLRHPLLSSDSLQIGRAAGTAPNIPAPRSPCYADA